MINVDLAILNHNLTDKNTNINENFVLNTIPDIKTIIAIKKLILNR